MNSERHLHISKHLVVDLNSLGDKFVSAYSLDGIHILPPLMTDIKRIEMQQLRLQALAIELNLKNTKLTNAEKQIKSLMPRMVNASTNTAMAENPNPNPNSDPNSYPKLKSSTVSGPTSPPICDPSPLVVIGRIRQELKKSQTAIFDYSETEPITVAPATIQPLLKASHVVIEDAPLRAVILPVELGTAKSSLVPKLNSSGPLQRSTDTIDLRVRTGQDRMPERPVVFPSSTLIEVASTKTAEGTFRSRIPIRRQPAAVLTTVQPPEVIVIKSEHGSGHERNGLNFNSANERRRNYGAKVALKRNEMSKKREELAKLKPPPRTTNNQVIKSIRTPIRRVEGGESSLDQQRFQIQEAAPQTNNNNQVPKSIRTPIRRVESGFEDVEMDQQRNRVQSLDQQTESSKTNNNQVGKSSRTPIRRVEGGEVPKSIRTPIRRVEGGESSLQQQQFQVHKSPRANNNNNQVPKSIRTPIRRLEAGFEEPHMEPKGNLFQTLDQKPASSKTNNNQVIKSIKTPIRRVGAGIEKPELLNQIELLRSLASSQEAEHLCLQAQLEREQQGLIDQLVGQIAHNDSQEMASEVTVRQ